MTPNMDAFYEAISITILATPFMFGALALFALVILALGGVQDRNERTP